MRHKKEHKRKIIEIEVAMQQFFDKNITIPFNLHTAHLLWGAFATEIAIDENIALNEDEYFGMLVGMKFLEETAKKSSDL